MALDSLDSAFIPERLKEGSLLVIGCTDLHLTISYRSDV